jgi:hypothetical protein
MKVLIAEENDLGPTQDIQAQIRRQGVGSAAKSRISSEILEKAHGLISNLILLDHPPASCSDVSKTKQSGRRKRSASIIHL